MESMESNGKGKFKRILGTAANFLSALIIFGIIIAAAGFFMAADTNSKKIIGNYESEMLSYNVIGDNKGEITAFGEKFVIDFNAADAVLAKIKDIVGINDYFTPSVIKECGVLVRTSFVSVGKIFGRLPSIAGELYSAKSK